MKKIEIDELRELQMQILDYVDAFCRTHDIKYTISGGTLLGAVRHGGYIPWDDDIDIQMLREEYNLFTRLWNNSKEEHPYEFVSIESGNGMGYAYGKVHNPQTVTYVNDVERTGVYIDVFPVDNVKDEADFVSRRKRIKWLKRKEAATIVLATKKSCWFNRLKCLLISMGKSRTYYAMRINEIALESDKIDCPLVFEMVAGIKCKRPISKTIFKEYEDIKFENRKYMAVKDYNNYLIATFGDYMVLPPIEKRTREHVFISFWREKV